MREDEKENKKTNNNSFIPAWIIWAVPAIVLVVWGANFYFANKYSKLDAQTYGQFGDFFGVSSSLIAGLALFLVALGVYFQKQELEKTKELLEEQSKITAAQEAALKKQNELSEKQSFETTFFNLLETVGKNRLNLARTVRKGSRGYGKLKEYKPSDVIKECYIELCSILSDKPISVSIGPHDGESTVTFLGHRDKTVMEAIDIGTLPNHLDLISRLYCFVYNASKVYGSNATWFEPEFYLAILKSQLIESEDIVTLVYIFENQAFENNRHVFLDLIHCDHFKINDYPDYFANFILDGIETG